MIFTHKFTRYNSVEAEEKSFTTDFNDLDIDNNLAKSTEMQKHLGVQKCIQDEDNMKNTGNM